jgi:hypothetical protein
MYNNQISKTRFMNCHVANEILLVRIRPHQQTAMRVTYLVIGITFT